MLLFILLTLASLLDSVEPVICGEEALSLLVTALLGLSLPPLPTTNPTTSLTATHTPETDDQYVFPCTLLHSDAEVEEAEEAEEAETQISQLQRVCEIMQSRRSSTSRSRSDSDSDSDSDGVDVLSRLLPQTLLSLQHYLLTSSSSPSHHTS